MPSILPLILLLLPAISASELSPNIGVNYGQLGDNLPSPSLSIHLIQKRLKASQVKLYDANPKILTALINTSIIVSVMLPNELIPNVSLSQSFSNNWVKTNLLPFYPSVLLRYLLVGNEVLTSPDNAMWPFLVPALRRVKKSLNKFKLFKIKIGTSSAMDVLQDSFPPSKGAFREDIADAVVKPMLQFLNRSKSFFFLDVYPYFPWAQLPDRISLQYALIEDTNVTYTDPNSGLKYTNLLDQMLDAVHFALGRLGYPNVRLLIAETGWPNGGDVDEIGANVRNAATYNRNFARRFTRVPSIGTPAMPGAVIPAFVFSLFNENKKPGKGTERKFGILQSNGVSVYQVDLSGKTLYYTDALPESKNDAPYKGKVWCVIAKGIRDLTAIGDALAFACAEGEKICEEIQPGKNCYRPDSLMWHASYAFSSYWSKKRSAGGTCYFGGIAVQTTQNPSFGNCSFPSVLM